jgi:hypothetical protein
MIIESCNTSRGRHGGRPSIVATRPFPNLWEGRAPSRPFWREVGMRFTGSVSLWVAFFLACFMALRADATNAVSPNPADASAVESDTANDAGSAPNSLLRDPFWPVHYVPSNPSPTRVTMTDGGVITEPTDPDIPPTPPKEPQWEAARKQLKIQGISRVGIDKKTRKPTFFAVINGRVVEEGAVVETITPDFKYRWKVASIAEKNVKLNPLDVQSP